MPVREIVHIDEGKCDGCGDCVPACAEGAIKIIDGKARLVADRLCDGLGACLGHCPQGTITVEHRDADDFDEAAVEEHLTKDQHHPESLKQPRVGPPSPAGCVPARKCAGCRANRAWEPQPQTGGGSNPASDIGQCN